MNSISVSSASRFDWVLGRLFIIISNYVDPFSSACAALTRSAALPATGTGQKKFENTIRIAPEELVILQTNVTIPS
jgi:hypothetical protein